jgi:two-component system, LytTR family, sensor kinase
MAEEYRRWSLRARVALIFGGWTAFGVLFATHTSVGYVYRGQPGQWQRMYTIWLIFSYIFCGLTPLILWLARRYPLERQYWLRRLGLHIAAAFGVAILATLICSPVSYMIAGDKSKPFSVTNLLDLFVLAGQYDIIIYFVLLGLNHTVDYYRKFNDREIQAAQLQAQLAQAHLDVLKMQLHPHFLFNTLNSISVLMQTDVQAAKHTLVCLSQLLRGALQASRSHEVALRQEVEFLQNYLEIEQTRFQDRLTARVHVDEEALDAQVPYFILQPLVENAIHHGGAGRIEVVAARENGSVHITVSDSGPGIQEDPPNRSGNGIGLANTRARLQKLYGDDCRFELVNSPEGGLTADITIPFRTAGDPPAVPSRSERWNESAY